MTTPTNNAIPSESPADLAFNAGKIDEFVNSPEEAFSDRFGVARLTITGIQAEADGVIDGIQAEGDAAIIGIGFTPVDSFEAGATITSRNQSLHYLADNNYYRWNGTLPKVVAASSTPTSSGGISASAWVNVTDNTLRSELATQWVTPEMYGAVGNGVTDDTTALQAAINSGLEVRAKSKTYLTGPLTMGTGSKFVGVGPKKTILKAINGSQIRIITIGGSGAQLSGVSLVGAGTSIIGDFRNGLLSVITATDFIISDIEINTAPNLGAMFYNCSLGVKKGQVSNLTVSNTGWKGIVVFSPCSAIDFNHIEQFGSVGNHGFSFDPYVWAIPIPTGSVSNINIDGLYVHDNPNGFGFFTFGLFAGGNSYDDFYYTFGEQMVSNCSFTNLRFDNNVSGAILGGSRCRYSNIDASDNGGSGMVINGYRCTFENITSRRNQVYGIDMGGASYCSVTNINLTENNPDGTFCIALNVGGCVGCTINGGIVADNGQNNVNCTALVVTGAEGDGVYAYSQRGGANRISNLYLRGSSNQYAIRAWRADAASIIENCTVEGFNTQTCIQNRTVNNHVPVVIRDILIPAVGFSEAGVVLPSATQLIIPDHAEFVYVTGTTAITSIATQTQADFSFKVNDVIPSNVGSGYVLTDTVTFTGDGSGAAGHVDVARASGGAITSIIIDNPGSGYSTCSVSINSSTGSGFVGEVILGANNCKERVVTLFFESAVNIQVTGMRTLFNALAGSTLTLKRMSNGSWAEISRAQ